MMVWKLIDNYINGTLQQQKYIRSNGTGNVQDKVQTSFRQCGNTTNAGVYDTEECDFIRALLITSISVDSWDNFTTNFLTDIWFDPNKQTTEELRQRTYPDNDGNIVEGSSSKYFFEMPFRVPPWAWRRPCFHQQLKNIIRSRLNYGEEWRT